ncbi:low molecular weight protein-tyrosine-phosphatase [uncultured Pelagimonas sp.]|uniref:low molecular weight protein-tyrosine-phosphatase n=1 Tax=uncultured Pelagimonas sp. TaxID=1618102 RepID=UPI00262F9B06|nr:low molecular weight protein-tyrosine-phosphatase [uncultured Pelagimonas sp.]
MTTRILFVCLGNICRSPSAEAVTRRMAEKRGVDIDIDSAGTGAWHVGEPPYGAMQQAALARGYDMSSLRARQVNKADFTDFDLIVAMDADNLANLRHEQPPGATAELVLFTDHVPQTGADHVPDPYYTRDFDGALDLIEQCAVAFLDQL